MATTSSEAGPSSRPLVDEKETKPAPWLDIPQEAVTLPTLLFALGAVTGAIRGGRMAGLRFTAENAHRAPTTMDGWYFYQKTKNYRMILGGVKGAVIRGAQLGGVGCVFSAGRLAGLHAGLGDWSDTVAGVGSAGVISAIYRLPRAQIIQLTALGAGLGFFSSLLRKLEGWMKAQGMSEGRVGWNG